MDWYLLLMLFALVMFLHSLWNLRKALKNRKRERQEAARVHPMPDE